MRKPTIQINLDTITNVNIQGVAYRVVKDNSMCFGCCFNTPETPDCPNYEMTISREGRGMLCTAFRDMEGNPLSVKFVAASDTDVPQVFIDKPVWETEE